LYARANGYLRKRFVDIGDHVKQGQLLALIDAPDLDQQVDQARQQLNQAEEQLNQQQATLELNRVTWERWRTLVAKGVFSRQDGDQRQTDFTSQAAVVASAHRNVDSYKANLARVVALQSYERVTAPFNGIITERNSDIGALVGSSGAASPQPSLSSPPTGGSANVAASNNAGSSGMGTQSAQPSTGQAQGGPLFGIEQIDKLRILVSVPEGYSTELKPGMPARVFVQERAGKPIQGTVTRVAGSIDQNTRTMLTEVDVDNRDHTLFPGMYAVVTFVQVRGTAPLTVPGDAVVVRQDHNAVAIVKDQKVQFVPIEVGRDYGPSVEVLGGLQEGDLVVVSVTDAVQQGVKVRPQQDKQVAEDTGQAAPSSKTPDSGPDQYGDQSLVNVGTSGSQQKGKSGGGQQKKGGSN
jgi:multidrug efflux pump subunit AcrA (membrane-fusion protein)